MIQLSLNLGDASMKEIKTLVELIKDELDGAEEYGKLSLMMRDTDATLSEVYAKLSKEELGHVMTLHGQVTRLIKEKNASGVETPPAMQAVWDWEHEKMINQEARIKAMLGIK